MNTRIFTIALLAGVSLATVNAAIARDAAPGPAKAQKAKKAKRPATVIPNNVVAQAPVEPARTARDQRSQAGLTSSPTDFGRVYINGGGVGGDKAFTPPTGLGVNGQDLGGGYMIPEEAVKTRSTVTRDAIAKQSPTANPYQLIDLLPGVNSSSTDNTGLNGGDIRIRGYTSSQLGLTIEGMPVNDSGSYALFPQEYVDSENIDQISIAQGSPDLDSPHIGASGGVINIYVRDPSKTAGGYVGQSLGSNSLYRSFVRAESGQIGDFRGFVSYSHLQDNHWGGQPGHDNRNHLDFKGVWEPGQGNRIALSLIYNAAINDNYANPTLAQWNAPGGYVSPLLSTLPSTWFTSSNKTQNSAGNYFEYNTNPFRNLIASAPSSFAINDKLNLDVIPYLWYGYGTGGNTSRGVTEGANKLFYGNIAVPITDWNQNGSTNAGETALLYNPSITETYRPGIINKLTYTIGDHKIVGGYWFEYAYHRQTAPFAFLDPNGKIIDPFDPTPITTTVGTIQRRDTLTKTITNTVFLGDTWNLMGDRLQAEFGAKVANANRTVYNYLPGTTYERNTNDTVLLPTFGLKYKITDEHTVFGSINTAFKAAPNFSLTDAVASVNTGIINPANPVKPERSITGEIGHRYQGQLFATSLSLYGSHYENRQVNTNTVINGVFENGVTINAGAVDIWGVAAEIGTRPLWGGFRPYVSGNYLQTRLRDNLKNDVSGLLPDALPTSGKELPASPHLTLAAGLDYDNGHILANVQAKYTDKQFSTFMNDESIPGFTRVNAMLGYRFDDIGFAKKPELRINFYNIFNSRNLVGVNSVQNNAIATKGVNGNTLNGSAPLYYAGQGFSFLATFSTAF